MMDVSIDEAPYAGFFLPMKAVAPTSFLTVGHHPSYGAGWLLFRQASETLTAWRVEETWPMLESVAERAEVGQFAAGFVSYEAAPAFDPAFEVSKSPDQPLACFHIYDRAPEFYKELEPVFNGDPLLWTPDMDRATFLERFRDIKSLLAQGVTYQVNFSFRLTAEQGDLLRLFWRVAADEPPPYASYFESPDMRLASLSPELFLESYEGRVRCKPMKGTATRGTSATDDAVIVERLRASEKDRAENLMVVDMVRNDLGRIAEIGSVTTSSLFEVETFPTVFQMTSTVEANVNGSIGELFAALFPCASIVGAPKVSTMREIARLESSARGVYTGAIGWIAPDSKMRFAVTIRTISAATGQELLTYGVGSGIVWDSDGESEWSECLLKARTLERSAKPWGLLETTRWTPEGGCWLLDFHLERLDKSAHEYGIPFDAGSIHERLAELSQSLTSPLRVRIVLGYDGSIDIQTSPLGESPELLRARIAATPICSGDPSLRIKSTWRRLYERQMMGWDEALLWNEKGEITEFCNGNVVAFLDGRLITPPIECGLLPGTMRAHLLRSGEIEEGKITLKDLARVTHLQRINSLRGRQTVEIIDPLSG